MQLPDGTIIPSFLGVSSPGSEPTSARGYGLKMCYGEIKEIIYPKADKSISKKFIEYRVIVQDIDPIGRPFVTEYGNCYASSVFGGVADKCRFTYRKQTKASNTGLGEGSKVVILCANGNSTNALIISGIRDGQNEKDEDPPEDDGHNLFWEFNGIRLTINKDGEFRVFRRGPTDADGHLDKDHKSEQSSANVFFDKDGNIEMTDAGDGNNTIKLNHKDDKIELKAAKGTLTTKSKGVTTIESTGDRVVLKSSDGISIGSADASESMVLGSTQRNGVKQMHNKMKSALGTAQQAIQQAGTQITQAAGLILPLTALPAKPGLIMAGQMLGQAASALSDLKSAIESYEGNADKELSEDHYVNK